jgi:mono/diheme cytochrome c family protein
MKYFFLAATALAIALLILIGILGVICFDISAIAEPGPAESYIASTARHFLIRTASRTDNSPTSAEIQVDPTGADRLYGMECAFCHGVNGPRQMDVGGWMNPRAADLSSADVQRYSDRELYWIVKNGIRLTGMPAFGKVETDEHIWKLVHYLRTLPIKAPGDEDE